MAASFPPDEGSRSLPQTPPAATPPILTPADLALRVLSESVAWEAGCVAHAIRRPSGWQRRRLAQWRAEVGQHEGARRALLDRMMELPAEAFAPFGTPRLEPYLPD